jgi:hypothetical protein
MFEFEDWVDVAFGGRFIMLFSAIVSTIEKKNPNMAKIVIK